MTNHIGDKKFLQLCMSLKEELCQSSIVDIPIIIETLYSVKMTTLITDGERNNPDLIKRYIIVIIAIPTIPSKMI